MKIKLDSNCATLNNKLKTISVTNNAYNFFLFKSSRTFFLFLFIFFCSDAGAFCVVVLWIITLSLGSPCTFCCDGTIFSLFVFDSLFKYIMKPIYHRANRSAFFFGRRKNCCIFSTFHMVYFVYHLFSSIHFHFFSASKSIFRMIFKLIL